jgi:hypothetical protein
MKEFHPETPLGPPKSSRFSRQQLKTLIEQYGFEEKTYLDLGTHYYVSFEKLRLIREAVCAVICNGIGWLRRRSLVPRIGGTGVP